MSLCAVPADGYHHPRQARRLQPGVNTNNPDTAFRRDPTSQQWIFNITTGNLAAGNTYIYTITLNDGTTIVFQYGLR